MVVRRLDHYFCSTLSSTPHDATRASQRLCSLVTALVPKVPIGMSVADKGYEMSNYGLKTYNPDQVKEMWKENIYKENKIARSHKATNMASETKKVCYLVIFSRQVK